MVDTIEIYQDINTIEISSPGPSGPIGPGGGSAYSLIAGETISFYQAVVIEAGFAVVADITDIGHVGRYVGLAVNSVLVTQSVNVQYTGRIPGISLIPDTRYYIGLGGLLTTNPSPVGAVWQVNIGITDSTGALVLTPDGPTVL